MTNTQTPASTGSTDATGNSGATGTTEPSGATGASTLGVPGPPAATPRLWNRAFVLLWQGQLVSSLGNVVYEIALGFWILATTGSTALMGTLMAASTLPRILVGPLGGVVVDRNDRKWLLVATDAIRGIFVVLVGIAAFAGVLHVWMVFVAGIIMGLG